MKTFLSIAALLWPFSFAVPAFADEAENKTAPTAAQSQTETGEEAEEVTDRTLYNEVRMLYATDKVDEAEEKFRAALEQFPDSQYLKSRHMTLYMVLSRRGRSDDAYRHLEAYVDHAFEQAVENPSSVQSLSSALGQLAEATANKDGNDRAMEVINSYLRRAEEAKSGSEALKFAVLLPKAILLGKSGKVDEGRAIVDERVATAAARLEARPENSDAITQMADALKNRLDLASAIEGGNSQAAWDEYSEYLDQQSQARPDNLAIVGRFAREHVMRAQSLARTAPDEAEAVLNRVTDFQEGEGADAKIPALVISQIPRVQQTIDNARKMLALIGSPALLPENVDAWVNSEPRMPESLQGKVVLLDFFAVWCGPCVATFPHLRQWHDDYSSQGLEIVGVSSYYKYGWNDETNRPERGEFTPEEEQAAMEQFVAYHELRHPIAYVTDSALKEHYVVTGIPHVVIIDRQGKVRLFRIGSGEKNAHDVEEAIKECLAE